MRERHYLYISSVILLLCFIFGTHAEVSARQTISYGYELQNDSIPMVERTDSLIGTDTIQTELSVVQQEELKQLEAPVDTATLVRQNDSIQQVMLQQQPTETKKKRWLPVPNNSIWLGLVLPGAGQIYNHKYWKLPIIYGGFLGCTYALTWNTKMYKDYSQAYQDIMSDNTENDSYMNFIRQYTKEEVLNNPEILSYYQNTFRQRKDAFRRQRDLSVIAFIAVYLLSVVDAYVDAELSNFDISNDLTMTLEPTIFNDAYRNRPQGIGIQCNIKF